MRASGLCTITRVIGVVFAAVLWCADAAMAQPQTTPWTNSTGATVAAAAPISGWYASTPFSPDIDIRDIRDEPQATIPLAQFQAIEPRWNWGATAGVCGMAWSDSGRLLFIAACNGTTNQDAIYRYDTLSDALEKYTDIHLADAPAQDALVPMAFFRGKLYTSSPAGELLEFDAARNTTSVAAPNWSRTVSTATDLRGLTIDREGEFLFLATDTGLYRAPFANNLQVFQRISSDPAIASIAFSLSYPLSGDGGLLMLKQGAPTPTILFASAPDARGFTGRFIVQQYVNDATGRRTLSPTPCGRLLVGTTNGTTFLSDANDSRLAFEDWLEDEFDQVLQYCKTLVREDGWVRDGSPLVGGTPGPPVTPDGALWVITMLLAADDLYADPDAEPMIQLILERYAGMADEGASPNRSADGIFEHWIDPNTGGVFGSYPQEYAIYSTMKIVRGAELARRAYPANPVIAEATARINCQIQNWESYFAPDLSVFLIARASGGPIDPGPRNAPFVEGILFAQQAAAYAGPAADSIFDAWLDRDQWPTAQFITGAPVTSASPGGFQPAFITLYPFLLTPGFRNSPDWREHTEHLLASFGAWTDDQGPQYFTAFSAGASYVNGYNADSLSNHPGDITHFPAVMGFAALGRTDSAVAAYDAYRRGARTTLAVGTTMLVRRSDINRGWQADIGLPDAAYGALGLAEVISPGVIDRTLAQGYAEGLCRGDLDSDFDVDAEDIYLWIAQPRDIDGDADIDSQDQQSLIDLAREDERELD